MKNYLTLSVQLIRAVKEKRDTTALEQALAEADAAELAMALPTDEDRMVFWINVYNSYILLLLRADPSLFEQRKAFFTQPRLPVAGQALSFDDIEHGLLRRSKIKTSLGYWNKLWVPAFERRQRVKRVDWRLHMALNCGARSCPPIEVFTPEGLQEQLDRRAGAYLGAHCHFDEKTGVLTVTPLMKFYFADFGGKKGILRICRDFGLLPAGVVPGLKFAEYDWSMELDQFA